MPGGGKLTIRLRKSSENTGQVIFQDSGIGMSREEQEQIFQPFHSGFGSAAERALTTEPGASTTPVVIVHPGGICGSLQK